jgi:L-ascorbate metabolism protein UlaG (beta-lactamase superfamily)
MLLIPAQKDAALLADIASIANDDPRLHLWWLGQSGFLIQQAGARFLFDPYLSDSLTAKYAATDKPHVRMTELCVRPEELTGIRHVTASHIHTDHLDAATLVPLAAANPGLRLFLPAPIVAEAAQRLQEKGFSTPPEVPLTLMGLYDDEYYSDDDWHIHAIPSAHNDVKRDEHGHCHYLGFIVKRNGFTLYHSGDTLWHEGLVEALLPHRCDVMFLPINGNKPERRVAGNLNGTEAAALAKACGTRLVIPCHYDMFEFNTETPEEFETTCHRLSQPYKVLQCGERVTLESAERSETASR